MSPASAFRGDEPRGCPSGQLPAGIPATGRGFVQQVFSLSLPSTPSREPATLPAPRGQASSLAGSAPWIGQPRISRAQGSQVKVERSMESSSQRDELPYSPQAKTLFCEVPLRIPDAGSGCWTTPPFGLRIRARAARALGSRRVLLAHFSIGVLVASCAPTEREPDQCASALAACSCDAQCATNTICVSGSCLLSGCSTDEDCLPYENRACLEGRCSYPLDGGPFEQCPEGDGCD